MTETPDGAPRLEPNVRVPLPDRIRHAYRPGIGYHDLMRQVFPADLYPRAMNTARQGGPPGCAMAFNAALTRMGARQGPYPKRTIWLP